MVGDQLPALDSSPANKEICPRGKVFISCVPCVSRYVEMQRHLRSPQNRSKACECRFHVTLTDDLHRTELKQLMESPG